MTVLAPLSGQYFVVNNQQAATSSVTLNNVTPPGPANILHNAANANEYTRAEANTYLHANIVRDLVLHFNPAYPTIANQTNFPINVNIALNCNAFYSPTAQSINFYVFGGGCNNTGYGTVVHHEYGHHVVQMAGSGQGAYGEGTGDCMGVLVSDDPRGAVGFHLTDNCVLGLRTADNTCQYQTSGCSSCGSEAHACGQLISGCLWSLRNQLFATNPSTYREILGDLAVNAILMHTGTTITPAIAIDYLTLDDNDANQENGTPHRHEIAAAFTAHNMAPPALPLGFTYPLGRPTVISPNGGTILRVVITAADGNPQPGATLNLDVGSGFTQIPMTPIAANTYEAAFPASPCGTTAKYYVSAQTTTATTATSPSGAPAAFYSAFSGAGLGAVAFDDNFQNNLGWTVANTATDGFWVRATPNTVCAASPHVDGDGSGMCYVTDNGTTCSSSDVDGGNTVLSSPNMDATGGQTLLSYWRWYSNNTGAAPHADTFVVEISSNGGTNWQNLETVGPIVQSDGGWFFKQFSLGSIPGFALTNQFRVRFTASDTGSGSTVEAAVDGVKLQHLDCGVSVPGDINGDGHVGVDDLLAVVAAWGPCPAPPAACPADVVVNGQVDVDDLLFIVSHWG